jgi:hypothetical protein
MARPTISSIAPFFIVASVPLGDDDDGFRGFVIEDIDGC